MSISFMRSASVSTLARSAELGGAGGNALDAAATALASSTSTPAGGQLAILSDETKVANIKKMMPSRKAYPTFEAAQAELEKILKATENAYGLPIGVVGFTPDGEPIEGQGADIYEGANTILAYVGGQVKGKKGDAEKSYVGIKGIVLFPAPTLETALGIDPGSIGEDTNGIKMLRKILEKEIGLVAFRPIREAATLAEWQGGVAEIPTDLEAYAVASERSGSGLDTATFDTLWNGFRIALKKEKPAISKLLPGKAEVIRALRSKDFAENLGEGEAKGKLEKAGMFVGIGKVLIQLAKDSKLPDGTPAQMDSSAIESWLAGRDEFKFPASRAEQADYSVLDDDNLDIAGMLGL